MSDTLVDINSQNTISKGIAISVILPSLNVGRYVKECLDSVVKQSLNNIEIICVDAGSTDGTREIIGGFAKKDSRITVVDSEKKSYGYQVNAGIKMARGKYIGIVDTDDYVDSDMFRTLYELAENTGFPDFIKCGFDSFISNLSGKLSWKNDLGTDRLSERIDLKNERDMAFCANSGIWAGIYKKAFLCEKDICFNETPGASYQDAGFENLVKMLADSVSYTDKSLYFYRLDNGSSSVRNNKLWHAVIDEWNYIEQKLLKETGSLDPYGLCLGRRIRDYGWTFDRLIGKTFLEKFTDTIRPEMNAIKNDKLQYERLTSSEQEILEKLLLGDTAEKQKRKDAANRLFLTLTKENAEYILMPAGVYGEAILFFQRILGKRAIRAICDNSKDKQDKTIGEYTVLSAEEEVADSLDDNEAIWLIASNKFGNEIKAQLLELGITEERIQILDTIPTKEEMIEVMVESSYGRGEKQI